ncbi:hypothetical protein XENTR_v10022340 [Xenopus tropicalis]|uniref:Extracellular matrix protein 1 n=1 Tax=Xenopus tropicalis TaxID=8364 RepID=A0A6I8QAK5_XENTR|nr:extracellular matrix protein 1 [Xenopus tropicalis]KAE8588095.1 hypothetical protein XENTR_v10022340 [Xenopus tropicalis]
MNCCLAWILPLLLLSGICQAHRGQEQREMTLQLPLLFQEQIQVAAPRPGPRGRRPTSPCSEGEPCAVADLISPLNRDLNDFPPGHPRSSNIENICNKNRPKTNYGPHNLPQTGFSYLSRQGKAINAIEEGYEQCCDQEDKLSCAEELWKKSLEDFCQEEFSIKTTHYHCCKKKGKAKEACFRSGAPNPSYSFAMGQESGSADVPRVGRARNLGECPPSSPHCRREPKYKLPDLSFPPGEPKASNIQNICKLRKLRPTYSKSDLPTSGFGHYIRQAKTINRLENEYKKCCRDEDVACAHIAWEKELGEFCTQEHEVFTKAHECCDKRVNMYSCFASKAPHPEYDKEVEQFNLSEFTPVTLQKLCGDIKVLTKHKQIPLLVSELRESCCSTPVGDMMVCADNQKLAFIETVCGAKKDLWKDSQGCCKQKDQERIDCFGHYLQNVLVALSHRNDQA